MTIQVRAINGMGSATDSLSGTVTTTGMEDIDIMATDNKLFQQAGVYNVNNDSLKVEENGTPNMSVNVLKGVCLVNNSNYSFADNINTRFWEVSVDATENVSIDNTVANPRIDLVTVKVDTTVSPNDEATNVATIEIVKGVEAGSPTAPALPNNHLLLAEVLVPNPSSTITNSDITEKQIELTLQPRLYNRYCFLGLTADVSIPNSSPTFIDWDLENQDPFNFHNQVTNPDRITVDKDGWYDIGYAGFFTTNSNGRRFAALEVNGVQVNLSATNFAAPPVGNSSNVFTVPKYLNAGDYVTLKVNQSSGGALNFLDLSEFFVMERSSTFVTS